MSQKTRAVIPQEAIQILSVLTAKEVSEVINHEVGFLRVRDIVIQYATIFYSENLQALGITDECWL